MPARRLAPLILALCAILAACSPSVRPGARLVISDGVADYPSRLRVGGPGTISVTLKNEGSAPSEVQLGIDEGYLSGFVLDETTPKLVGDSSTLGTRWLRFPDLAPGSSQSYRIKLVGKQAGEYTFKLLVMHTDRHFDGRTVIVP